MEPDKNTGVYRGLVAQVNRIHRHTRQGSYETKKRYKESELRFCAFEAVEFHVQKLENIRPEHLVAYVEFMIAAGKAPATIKKLALRHSFLPRSTEPSSVSPSQQR